MDESRENNKKNKHTYLKKVAVTVSLALIFGLVSGTTFRLMTTGEELSKKTEEIPEVLDEIEEDLPLDMIETEKTVAEVAADALPSIVAITTVSIQEIPDYFGDFGFFWGFGNRTQKYQTVGSGSGIIIGENETELLIVTNQHVVDGAKTISVCFLDEAASADLAASAQNGDFQSEYLVTGKVKGEDKDLDVAIVAVNKEDIDSFTRGQLRIAEMDEENNLVVGEQVVAIGNALGFGQSVTSGYISALNRRIAGSERDNARGLIQTDAAINPGNSGGALLNMKGQVIGINSAKYASDDVEGMGYAIPITEIKTTLEELMQRKTRDYVSEEDKAAYLGITGMDLTTDLKKMYNLPSGVYIKDIDENGPAALAGVELNDILASLDGQKITSRLELENKLNFYESGETVTVEVYRMIEGEYQLFTFYVTFSSRAQAALENEISMEDPFENEWNGIDDFFDMFG